jgi:hypothetical protein
MAVRLTQESFFLQDLIVQVGNGEQGKQQEEHVAIEKERADEVQVEEDKDRVARETIDAARDQLTRALLVDAQAPRTPKCLQGQQANQESQQDQTHSDNPARRRTNELQTKPLRQRRVKAWKGVFEHSKGPDIDDNEESQLNRAENPPFSQAQGNGVDTFADAQLDRPSDKDEKEQGQRSYLEGAQKGHSANAEGH